MRERGIVKWFSAPKGYGFIKRSTGEDVFVHYSSIEMAGYRKLREGAEVEFELKEGPRGLLAVEVVRVDGEAGEKAEEAVKEPSPERPTAGAAKAETEPLAESSASIVDERATKQANARVSNQKPSHADGEADSSGFAKGQSAGG